MKKKYLVHNNPPPKSSGAAAFVYAYNKEDILKKFPLFKVFDLETEEISPYFNEQNTLVTDIDDLTGWLKSYYERNLKNSDNIIFLSKK